MPAHPPVSPGHTFRHFTVAVFVVREDRVLMHFHRKLARWLPPGGHIEDDELPDEAAVREVLEETGVVAQLLVDRGLPIGEPRQLVVPAGIQVERIYPGHEHIDLVYFAVPVASNPDAGTIDPALAASDQVGWLSVQDLAALDGTEEMVAWATRAIAAVNSIDRS